MKWEYKVTGILDERDLNVLGAEGWELLGSGLSLRNTLKRPQAAPAGGDLFERTTPENDLRDRADAESVQTSGARRPRQEKLAR